MTIWSMWSEQRKEKPHLLLLYSSTLSKSQQFRLDKHTLTEGIMHSTEAYFKTLGLQNRCVLWDFLREPWNFRLKGNQRMQQEKESNFVFSLSSNCSWEPVLINTKKASEQEQSRKYKMRGGRGVAWRGERILILSVVHSIIWLPNQDW